MKAALRDERGGAAWLQWLRETARTGAVHPEEACVGCGAATTRRAVTAVTYTYPDHNSPELTPWCERCEAGRVRRQYVQLAGNPALWPELREAALEWVATEYGVPQGR